MINGTIISMKRYMLIGCGSRAVMYLDALTGDFSQTSALVALCDLNPHRLQLAQKHVQARTGAHTPVAGGPPEEFEKLIVAENVDTVIITTMDRTHDQYIVRAMEAGCDVVVEKPLTIDARRLNRIREKQAETGKSIRVTFNYRYAPRNSIIRELLQVQRVIGTVRSVHFEWLLDTVHGADYFRRWHRDKRNSGGLLVHKATHHFDLMNWWLADDPETVYASGDLVFYGRENAEFRGVTRFPDRGTGANPADHFTLDLAKDERFRDMYLAAEQYDGYRRDEHVFGHYISIEDDLSVLVRYTSGVRMTYHLTAYSPWEGFRIAFNGDGGRLEYSVIEQTTVSGGEADAERTDQDPTGEPLEPVQIRVLPLHGKPWSVTPPASHEAGHGGGDRRMLQDILEPDNEPDPLHRAADSRAGMYSIAVGIAGNMSIARGTPVLISEVLRGE
jgi:predicted dehydrogenase